jgi:hypothetical protein
MYQLGSDSVPAQLDTDAAPDSSTTGVPTVATAGEPPSAKVPARAFVTELAHAMQAAAEHQREATNAEVEAITSAHLERVRARAVAEAEELRRKAQQDIDAINIWQEAEAERVRAEAAARIVVRGEELDGHLVRHAALIDSEVEQIAGVVAGYQLQLGDYFDRLTAESNPGVIARLADQMPEPPDLARVGGDARAWALAAATAEGDAASSREASATDLVPVMDPAATAAGSGSVDASVLGDARVSVSDGNGTDDNGTNGSNGDSQERLNPAIRLLRSITTHGAPPAEAKDAAAADRATNGATDGTSDDAPGAETAGEVAPAAVDDQSR